MAEPVSGEATWRRSRTVQTVAAPALGADWTLTVPAGHLFQLLSVFAVLATSAVAATRVARLSFGDGDSPFLDLPPFASQLASLTRRYAWVPAGQGYASGNGILSPLPDIVLQPGWTVGTITDVIDFADAWTGIRINVIDTTVRGGKLVLSHVPDVIVATAPALTHR